MQFDMVVMSATSPSNDAVSNSTKQDSASSQQANMPTIIVNVPPNSVASASLYHVPNPLMPQQPQSGTANWPAGVGSGQPLMAHAAVAVGENPSNFATFANFPGQPQQIVAKDPQQAAAIYQYMQAVQQQQQQSFMQTVVPQPQQQQQPVKVTSSQQLEKSTPQQNLQDLQQSFQAACGAAPKSNQSLPQEQQQQVKKEDSPPAVDNSSNHKRLFLDSQVALRDGLEPAIFSFNSPSLKEEEMAIWKAFNELAGDDEDEFIPQSISSGVSSCGGDDLPSASLSEASGTAQTPSSHVTLQPQAPLSMPALYSSQGQSMQQQQMAPVSQQGGLQTTSQQVSGAPVSYAYSQSKQPAAAPLQPSVGAPASFAQSLQVMHQWQAQAPQPAPVAPMPASAPAPAQWQAQAPQPAPVAPMPASAPSPAQSMQAMASFAQSFQSVQQQATVRQPAPAPAPIASMQQPMARTPAAFSQAQQYMQQQAQAYRQAPAPASMPAPVPSSIQQQQQPMARAPVPHSMQRQQAQAPLQTAHGPAAPPPPVQAMQQQPMTRAPAPPQPAPGPATSSAVASMPAAAPPPVQSMQRQYMSRPPTLYAPQAVPSMQQQQQAPQPQAAPAPAMASPVDSMPNPTSMPSPTVSPKVPPARAACGKVAKRKKIKNVTPVGGGQVGKAVGSDDMASPDALVMSILQERGYPTKKMSSVESGYQTKPTPLQLASFGTEFVKAVHTSNVTLLKTLLDCGISPNPCNAFGDSIIDTVCKRSKYEIFKVLVDHGCDIQVSDGFGRTPLHHAAWAGNFCEPLVHLILQMDPLQVLVQDKHGRSPMQYVRKENWNKWIAFLQKNKDTFWRAGGSFRPLPRDTKQDDARESVISCDLAKMVASGEISPQEAMAMDVETRRKYKGDVPDKALGIFNF